MSAVENSDIPNESHSIHNKTPSMLEYLPLELLEKVFLYSLNINLLRMFPCLENERIYKLLILLAFWNNDYEYDRESDKAPKGRESRLCDSVPNKTCEENKFFYIPWILRPLGHDYVPLTFRERGALQSSVLQCDWCTKERILKQFPDLARLTITRWCINAGYKYMSVADNWELKRQLHSGEETEPYPCLAFRTNESRPDKETTDEGEVDDYSPWCEIDFRMGKYLRFSYIMNNGFGSAMLKYYPFLSIREIPSSLLSADINSENRGLVRGTFTDAHLSLLNILIDSDRLFPEVLQGDSEPIVHSQDALWQGIHIALMTVNPKALNLLLKIKDFLSDEPPGWESELPSSYFRTAAQMYVNERKNKCMNGSHNALLCFCILLVSGVCSVVLTIHWLGTLLGLWAVAWGGGCLRIREAIH